MKNTKRLLAVLLVLAMVLVYVPTAAFAADETNENGYIEIYTVEDLYNVRNDLTANYILMNDIDLTEATAVGGEWDFEGRGWNPIGSENIYCNSPFTGIFDGNGHRIAGMRIAIDAPGGSDELLYGGLFANVAGTVCNLSIENAEISGSLYRNSVQAGVLAGEVSGTIQEVSVSGALSLTTGNEYDIYAGGIAGRAESANVYNCVSDVEIEAHADGSGCTGGLFSFASGTIDDCFNLGSIIAYSGSSRVYASGIANVPSYTKLTVKNCYNVGDISGTTGYNNYYSRYVAGISYAAWGELKVIFCYNIGVCDPGYGISEVTSENCYYLSGSGSSAPGSAALTEAQMKLQSVYSGFDFENTWILSPYANYPYPQLRSNPQDLREKVDYVTVVTWPNKTEYYVGEELDLTGSEILVEYANGEAVFMTPTADMLSGYDMSTAGEKTVTVTVNGVSDSFSITVVERPEMTSLELISQPDRTTFTIATAFDFTGAVVRATYADGSAMDIPVTMEMCSGGNIRKLGTQTITVTYGEKTTTFTVTVVAKTSAMSGTVAIVGTPTYGSTLTIDTSKVMPEAATYTYDWYADGEAVGTGSTYTVAAADVGKAITVAITGSGNYKGTLTSEAVTGLKAAGAAAAAPTVAEVTETTVTLNETAGCEYSLDGTTWQASAVFENLTDGTSYTFYQRLKETDTNYAGAVSNPLVVTTLKAPEGPKTDASFKFSGASLTLQHNIAVNFKADKALFTTGGFTDPYVVFEMNGAQTTVTNYTVSGNRYVFSFKNIAPNRMNDTISATMYATKDGELYASATRTYSVAEYSYSMLELYSADQYAELRTLLVDLLNYGAASQWYTGYNVDNLVNENLTDAQKQWGTAETPALESVLNTAYETVESPKATWRGAGLQLNDAVSVRLSFKTDNVENLKVVVKTDSQEWTLDTDEFVENNGAYYVYFNGLHAGQMRETFYITIYEGNTAVSNTARYSIESYAEQKVNDFDLDLADLVVAMMKYGDSANAYIN